MKIITLKDTYSRAGCKCSLGGFSQVISACRRRRRSCLGCTTYERTSLHAATCFPSRIEGAYSASSLTACIHRLRCCGSRWICFNWPRYKDRPLAVSAVTPDFQSADDLAFYFYVGCRPPWGFDYEGPNGTLLKSGFDPKIASTY